MASRRGWRRTLLAATLAVGGLAVPGPLQHDAHAAAYDPDLTWRTLQTEHFNVHFHGGLEQLADECAAALELAWDELVPELKTAPRRRIEVVLVDNTDSANGYAQTVPLNTIVMFVTAPTEDSTLSSYDHWPETIMTHELVHILHIDTVEGLPGLVRKVLGRVISVNRVSPGWVVEGFATFQETRHTTTGRGRASIPDMIKRMSVLEDRFPPLGNMDGWQSDLPAGNLRYLFGQDFIEYVADSTGEDAWTDWIHVYGRGIPYLLPGPRVFDKRLLRLYKEWRAEMTARYERQAARVEAQGLTPFTVVSDGTDRCAGPRFSPDGSRLVYACTDPRRGTDTWLADRAGGAPEVVLDGRGAAAFTWRRDGRAFAFASSRVVNRYNVWNDVNLHRIDRGTETMTRGARARDPEFSPDGESLLVVTNGAQDNQLERLTVDRTLTPLTSYEDHTQLSTPRYSPDGKWVALSRWTAGQRDIWLYTADGTPWRRVTADGAQDIDPAWSPDGRTLYFSSDRTGIFNLYAVDLESERLWQVSNVLGGAFGPAPHPDGHALVFESFSHDGQDIAWMPLDRSQWWDRGLLSPPVEHSAPLPQALPADDDVLVASLLYDIGKARRAWEEDHGPGPAWPAHAADRSGRPAHSEDGASGRTSARERPVDWDAVMWDRRSYPGLDGLGGAFLDARQWEGSWGLPGDAPDSAPDEQFAVTVDDATPEEEEDYAFSWPVKRYSPWSTLLPPRYVLPRIYQTSYGFQGVVSTSGADTLRRYLYSGYLSYRTDSRYLGWGASFTWNRWVPILSAGAFSYTTPYSDVYVQDPGPEQGSTWIPGVESTNQRYWDKRIRMYGQVTHSLDDRRSIFGRWTGTTRQPLDPLGPDAYRPFLPTRGFISSVGGGWRYSRGKSYDKSISPEEARIVSLVGEVTAPWLGAYVLDDQDERVGFTQVQATGEWREYRTVPWLANHVLAMKLAGGVSAGDENRYGSFRLGGSFGESAYYTLPDEWRSLRGFPTAVVYGDSFYLGSVEYRLPLWRPERGFGTVPFFARYLSAAVFADAGNAFSGLDDPAALQGVRVGTGAELIGTAIIGWGVPVRLRVGYAFGAFGEGGYRPGDLGGAYLWFGSSF